MDQRVSLITLGVADLQRAQSFYEGLGWFAPADENDDVVFFPAGGIVVALWDRSKLAADSAVTDGGMGRRHPRVQRPIARGGRRGDRGSARGRRSDRTGAGGDLLGGGYSGVFVDPDGHPWEVAHNPAWTVDDDGSITL